MGVGDANKVLKEWPDWSGRVSPLSGGLINATYIIERSDGEQAILQRLNTEIFTPLVHNDIDCVTQVLVQKGVMTPRLIPTATGTLWHQAGDATWRMMTVVGERTTHQLNSAAAAESAGALVGWYWVAL